MRPWDGGDGAPATRVHCRAPVGTVPRVDEEIRVTVNGEFRRLNSGTTVAALPASMDVRGPCAVERNR